MHFSWQCQTRALKRCCQLSSYACGNSVAAALRVCQDGARNPANEDCGIYSSATETLQAGCAI